MFDTRIPSLDGRHFDAYVARPDFVSAPAIIVIQEIFGVNPAMRGICDDLARDGYLAICPDLFWRLEPHIQLSDQTDADMKQAFGLYERFDVASGVDDLLAALAYARTMPGCNGKVGTVGYCLGGKLAFLLTARSDLDCGVSYYGVGLENLLEDVPDIRCPLLMHMAGKDKFSSPQAQEKVLAAVAKNSRIQAPVYPDADHAFARPGGVHWDEAAAALANKRSAEFFAAHLRS
ncbi:MAG: dienelactone hydrolase family protein [Alphaproteobacteria bacterium]